MTDFQPWLLADGWCACGRRDYAIGYAVGICRGCNQQPNVVAETARTVQMDVTPSREIYYKLVVDGDRCRAR